MASGERTIKVKFDGSAKGLAAAAAEARAEMAGLSNELDGHKKKWDEASQAIGRAWLQFGKIALVASSLNPVLHAVVALGQGMVTLAQGALPLAVGGALALGAAMVTLKLGADGVKQAFQALTPQLDALKAGVSAAFEKSLAPAVNDLKTILPQVAEGFKSIATAMGGALSGITAWLRTSEGIVGVNTILFGTSGLIQNLGRFLAPVVAGFVNLGAAAVPVLTDMTSGLGNVGDRFKSWVDRMVSAGNVTQWMTNLRDLFKSMRSTLSDLGQIVSAVFGALEDAGFGLTGVLGGALGALKSFLQSASGHDAIVALAQAIQRVGDAVGRVLKAALDAIGPALPDLADAFGRLASMAADVLVPAIEFLAPTLQAVAKFIAENINWLGPLAIALGILAAAIWVVNAALDANPFVAIATAIAVVVVLIITHWSQIESFLLSVWNKLKAAAQSVADFFVNIWNHVVDFFKTIGSKISGAFTSVLDWFQSLPGKVGSFLASLPGIIGNALLTALKFGANAVLQGIEWIIAEFIALPLQIGWLLAKLGEILFNAFSTAFQWAVNAVVTGAQAVFDFVITIPGTIWNFLSSLPGLIGQLATDAWNWFLNTTTSIVNNVLSFVVSIPGRIWDGLSALGGMIAGLASGAWNWFVNASIDAASGIWGFVSSIPGRILGALGDLGNLLVNAGRAVISGLLNGIKSAVQGVWDFVSGIAGKIAALKGPLPYDRQLLIPAGQAIMNGLREGLMAGFGSVQTLVGGMADQLEGSFSKQMNISATGSISGSTTLLASGPAASAFSPAIQPVSGGQAINLTLDLGAGIQQRIQVQLDSQNRATARAIGMGVGASR